MYGAKFEGYLLKFTKTEAIFPTKLISAESFKSTPRQRTEIKAYRDSLNNLHRTTSPNHKSKLVFSTTQLSLSELREILDILDKAYSNKDQRKVDVKYWDDELMRYRTMTAYIPDLSYTKEKITENSISYSPVEFTFIEY